MSTVSESEGVARPRVDWMRPSDDVILETLRDHGQLTPTAFGALDSVAKSTARNRLPKLKDGGLVELYHGARGLYTLTEKGHAYLDEELEESDIELCDSND